MSQTRRCRRPRCGTSSLFSVRRPCGVPRPRSSCGSSTVCGGRMLKIAGSPWRGAECVLGRALELRGEGFDRRREDRAVGRAAACSSGSVASVRSVRWLQAAALACGERTAAPSRAAPAGDENPSEARRGGGDRHRLSPGRLADPRPTGSARRDHDRQRRLACHRLHRRRAGCALGRAGTETSWGRSAAAPARAPICATRSRSWWPRP
jgi:hypothetical protein